MREGLKYEIRHNEPELLTTLISAVHFTSSVLSLCIEMHVGHLVTSPSPRGNGIPLKASKTDDLPPRIGNVISKRMQNKD